MLTMFVLCVIGQIPLEKQPERSASMLALKNRSGFNRPDVLTVYRRVDGDLYQVPAAVAPEFARPLMNFLQSNDSKGLSDMFNAKHAFAVDSGTRVRVVDLHPLGTDPFDGPYLPERRYVQVRIESPGPHKDELVFMEGQFVQECVLVPRPKKTPQQRAAPVVNPHMQIKPAIRRETELLDIAKEVERDCPAAAIKLYKILARDYPKSPEAIEGARRIAAIREEVKH